MEGVGFAQRKGWWLILLLIAAGQGYLTLRFFDASSDLTRLADAEPILSGKHPLHLYHGWLGANAWRERGTSTCYDPAFQVGYPKTPVFDSGSRLAELFLLMAGGECLSAYKIGLALGCLAVPGCFALFARGLNLPAGTACLTALLGSLLWWSPPIRQLLHDGDFDLLLGTLCLLIHLGWWVRFSFDPWLDSWLVLTITSVLGWYTQPLLMIGFCPLIFLLYCWVGYRHGVAWHLSILATVVLTVVFNFPWFADWVRYALPLLSAEEAPSVQSLPWKSLLLEWHTLLPQDALGVGVGTIGFVGLLGLVRMYGSPAGILFLTVATLIALGAAGKCWQPLCDLGVRKVLAVAVWSMVPSCAYLMCFAADRLGRSLEARWLGFVWLVAALGGLAWALQLPQDLARIPPLPMGLSESQKQLVELLKLPEAAPDAPVPTGRVLWEDRPAEVNRWTPLLKLQTGRDVIGGLDPDGSLEHSRIRLVQGKLRERAVQDWGDGELLAFLDRYNIQWVVAWSPEALQRFRGCRGLHELAARSGGDAGALFEVERTANLFLRGTGKVMQLDWQRVALADLMPNDDGEVVLSLHYQSGWRIAPPYVEMEKAILDPFDPIPMTRLKLPGPLARVTLVWENR